MALACISCVRDPHATWSEVQTVLLAPFRRAVRDGHAMGVMASYNDYDGVPVIASRQFLTDILRGEYGFKGYVVSDSGAVEFLHQKHRVAPTPSDGILQAVQAGLNVRTNFTPPEAYVQPLRELVKSGRLPMATVDARVRDILRVKYWIGLFDAPYGLKPEAANGIVRSPHGMEVAERAAREAIILLKNEGKLLPLPRRLSKVLVAGPLADDLRAWWCRYGPQRLDFVTPLAGIRKNLGASAEVRYVKGVEARDANWPESDIYREAMPREVRSGIDAAVKAAAGVDVILLVVGEPEELSRESRSRISLELPGYQEDLLRALHATRVPLVVVVSSGRPQAINFAAKHARAIVNLWYLGENGGSALADVLFGDYNPAGRLPITVPRSVGQLPFPFKPGAHGRDEGQVSGPLYAFGHGLSYTQFEYSGLRVSPARNRLERQGVRLGRRAECRRARGRRGRAAVRAGSVSAASRRSNEACAASSASGSGPGRRAEWSSPSGQSSSRCMTRPAAGRWSRAASRCWSERRPSPSARPAASASRPRMGSPPSRCPWGQR